MEVYMKLFFIFALFLAKGFALEDQTFNLRVDFKKAVLTVSKGEELVMQFKVATPIVQKHSPVVGEVKKVEVGVNWYPTEPTRRAYKKRTGEELPKVVPAVHKLNAIGAGKIHINWMSGNMSPVIMIHGTNDNASIGQRVTRGCIRLRNEDFLVLAETIKGKKTSVIFE